MTAREIYIQESIDMIEEALSYSAGEVYLHPCWVRGIRTKLKKFGYVINDFVGIHDNTNQHWVIVSKK